jgi:hypothetical protein
MRELRVRIFVRAARCWLKPLEFPRLEEKYKMGDVVENTFGAQAAWPSNLLLLTQGGGRK